MVLGLIWGAIGLIYLGLRDQKLPQPGSSVRRRRVRLCRVTAMLNPTYSFVGRVSVSATRQKKSRRHRLRLFCTRYSDNFLRILEQRFQQRLLLSIPFILTVKHLQLLGRSY